MEKNNDICQNCGEILSDEDKFCAVCGTRRGEEMCIPYSTIMECVYGPPLIKRTYTCLNCGYVWELVRMFDDQSICPKCGSEKLEVDESDD